MPSASYEEVRSNSACAYPCVCTPRNQEVDIRDMMIRSCLHTYHLVSPSLQKLFAAFPASAWLQSHSWGKTHHIVDDVQVMQLS